MDEICQGITIDSRVRFGRPVIKGTRVSVEVILEELGSGASPDEAATAYGVSREDVLNCIRFARREIVEREFRAA